MFIPLHGFRGFSVFLLAISFPIIGYARENQDSLDTKDWRPKFRLRGDPTIMVHYGVTQHDAIPLTKDFRRVGQLTLQIGYRTEDFGVEDYLTDYSWYGLTLSHYSGDLWKSHNTSTTVTARAWQFGLGSENGDGYTSEGTSIIPYRSSTYGWTRIQSELANVSSDSATLLLYQGTFRFGQVGGMGVQAQFLPVLGIDAAYKRGVVFPRHLFLKHLGSVVVEEVAHGMVRHFVDRVLESSPAAGPIIGFLLHGGITYGIYELRKERMHWPFETAQPVTYDAFSLGIRLNL